MNSLVTLDDLKRRLDFDLDAKGEDNAQSALDDASVDACYYGSDLWTSTTCPPTVKMLVLRAVKRYMDNYTDLDTSRSGDEQLRWRDRDLPAGGPVFTDEEKQQLSDIALGESLLARGGVMSVPTSPWGTRDECATGWVPCGNQNSVNPRPFPFFADDWR